MGGVRRDRGRISDSFRAKHGLLYRDVEIPWDTSAN